MFGSRIVRYGWCPPSEDGRPTRLQEQPVAPERPVWLEMGLPVQQVADPPGGVVCASRGRPWFGVSWSIPLTNLLQSEPPDEPSFVHPLRAGGPHGRGRLLAG